MLRAVEVIRKLSSKAKETYLQAFEKGDLLLQEFGITTSLRLAHFLGQVLHETGGCTVLYENLRYTSAERLLEIFGVGNHSAAIRPDEVNGLLNNPEALAERVYGLGNPPKAKELGNTRAGDGYRYRGAGALQTTGGANYKTMTEKTGVDFYNNPELIVDPAHLLKPALHKWKESNLNAAADQNDIEKITRAINGGLNGLSDRTEWFEKAHALLETDISKTDTSENSNIQWIQQSLNTVGYQPQLTVDGINGPATTDAVRWFQEQAGLTVDGIAGEATQTALRAQLEKTA
jgi:putative chitinase